MNLSEVTDIKELKAIAYDTVVELERAQNNLRLINQRIVEIQEETVSKPKEDGILKK